MIGGVLKRHIKGHKEMVDHNRDAVGGHENHNNNLVPKMRKKPIHYDPKKKQLTIFVIVDH